MKKASSAVKHLNSKSQADPKDHLANERTFLSWVRTSIGIMAFGFVVEKFALFINQVALLLGKALESTPSKTSSFLQGYSSLFGLFLVALGVLICLLAFMKYKNVEKQLEDNNYHPSMFLNVIVTSSVVVTGIFLIVYLSHSIF